MNLILASQSPRRQEILRNLGYTFEIKIKEVEEIYPPDLNPSEVPAFLANLKANPFKEELKFDDLLLTSDTIVLFQNQVLGKPKDREEAIQTLHALSENMHEVITGVQLTSLHKTVAFSVVTKVYFKKLTLHQIDYYIDTFKPYDKAGSYGIQEWIGQIGVERIEGSFYNVMGLPTAELYAAIQEF